MKFLGAHFFLFLGRAWAEGKGELATSHRARTADRKWTVHVLAMIYLECAALASALESASRRNTIPERVTIFTDAQAAIKRMASDEPGPGQQYALHAQKHIAALRRARPGIIIEIRWCPVHKGIAGNEKADEWAKIVAGEPDTHAGEWLNYSDRTEVRAMTLPLISRQPQAGDLGEEVGGGPSVSWRPVLQDELPDPQQPAA